MARTALTPQQLGTTMISETFVAGIADGHKALFNGKSLILHFKNIDSATTTITVQTPGKWQGLSLTAPTYIIPITTGDKIIEIPCNEAFIQSDGMLYWDYSSVVNVTVAVLQP